jgi:hypothetical protein
LDPKIKSKTNRILEDSDESSSDDDKHKKAGGINAPTGFKMDTIGDDSDDDGMMLIG